MVTLYSNDSISMLFATNLQFFDGLKNPQNINIFWFLGTFSSVFRVYFTIMDFLCDLTIFYKIIEFQNFVKIKLA